MKLSINARILLGFLVLIAIYGISGFFSLQNLDKSREITTKNSSVIQPSIIYLNRLELMELVSKNYTNTWIVNDLSDHEDKLRLREIHFKKYPALKKQLISISKKWNNEEDKLLLDSTIVSFEKALSNQKMIMNKLVDIDAYKDVFLRIEAEQNYMEEVIASTERSLTTLSELINRFNVKAENEEEQILESFSSIRTSNILLIILAAFIGLIVALATLRSVKLEEQKNKVTKERDLVQTQKLIIEEKNQEITDSINYAKRIQQAILPSKLTIEKYLKNCFIYYQPRDIVSGDFYWFHELNEDEVLIAAADSTGHGVPGAFVSFVCYSSLNRAVNEFGIQKPNKILDTTCTLVQGMFAQYGEGNVQDGMDIALCKMNLKNNTLEFSGAHNSAYVIRNKEAHQLKATRQSIGGTHNNINFENHTFQLEKGDVLYIFSDGFQDQFGGPNNKKYKTKNFINYLVQIASNDSNEQKELLANEFNMWRQNEPQVDDLLVIGIKI